MSNNKFIKKMADGGPIKRKKKVQGTTEIPKSVAAPEPLTNPAFYGPDVTNTKEDQQIKNWMIDYIKSPKYRERLGNFKQLADINDIINNRADAVNKAYIYNEDRDEGSALLTTGNLAISPKQLKELKASREEVLAHELSHLTNAWTPRIVNGIGEEEEKYLLSKHNGTYEDMEGKMQTLSPEDKEKYINQMEDLAKRMREFTKKKEYTLSDAIAIDKHDLSPMEVKSDLDAVRYLMNKEGLYDAKKQDLTPEIYKKAKESKTLQDSHSFQRLLKSYSDDDLIDILNKVAYNNNNNQIPIAKTGTVIENNPTNPVLTGNDIYNQYVNNFADTSTLPTDNRASTKFLNIEQQAYDKYTSKPQKRYNSSGETTAPLSQGKLRGAKPNKELLNDLVAAADRNGVPRDQMLALAANESMFGQGYRGNGRRGGANAPILQQNVISSWNMDQQYKPSSSSQFAYNKKIPGVKLDKNAQGYNYSVEDMDRYKNSLDSALAIHPEWIEQYQQLNANVKPQGDINYFDLTAQALKSKGLGSSAFNPGDPNYAQKIREAQKLVDADPVLAPYLKKMEFGGNIPLAKSGIHIKPENKGKFTAYKKRTGKTTEEALHSKDPHVRQMANFARMAKRHFKKLDGGGIVDPNDPMFAQQMQEFIKNNPEALKDIFNSTPNNYPGAGDQINLPENTSGAWDNNPLIVDGTNSSNTNQQNKNKKKFNVDIPNINVGNVLQGVIGGADALVTNLITNPRNTANEMRRFRRLLTGVNSKPSQGGYDMPILAKSGIKITSAYDLHPEFAKTAAIDPWGNLADQYKVDHPKLANVQTEGGEFLTLPDGKTSSINGDKHSDYSGGELMRLPEGSKVYSDSIKVDNTFAKDLTGSKFKRKKTVADIAKKFDTKHEQGILDDPTADRISKTSANIMQTFKEGQLQQLFDYQESVKDPMYMLNKDSQAEDYTEGMPIAKYGAKIMAEGGEPPKKKRITKVNKGELYYTPKSGAKEASGVVVNNNNPFNVLPLPPGATSATAAKPYNQQWWNTNTAPVPATTTDDSSDEVTDLLRRHDPKYYGNQWWYRDSEFNNRYGEEFDQPLYYNHPGLGDDTYAAMSENAGKYTTPDSTPNSTPDSTPEEPWTPLDLQKIKGVRPPDIQQKVPPVTIPTGTTPIDPNKFRKPIPDNNKANPPAPAPKVPWGNTLNSLGEITPEIFAMIQNQTDFPIFTDKYQPKYLNPVEMNIQASLNRNYAQTKPLLEGTGNAATDSARQAQALANLYDANNQMFEQKFNFDTQNRYQTDAANLQIENEANRYNLQRADDFWNKVTARQAVKEASNNNIVNSAYAKFKRKQFEDRSLQLTNQLFENFKYDPERGIYFDDNGNRYIFHQPSGAMISLGSVGNDGYQTTKTTQTDSRGRAKTTIKQKEDKNS